MVYGRRILFTQKMVIINKDGSIVNPRLGSYTPIKKENRFNIIKILWVYVEKRGRNVFNSFLPL